MKQISYGQTLKKHWDIIALITGIALVVSLGASIIQPFKYEAKTRLLVIQNQVSHLDAYTATKSAEKIGKNLSEVVASTAFFKDVITLYPALKDEFPTDPIKLRKEWKKDIVANVIPETGILEISAFHEDPQKASDMLQTISYAIVNQGNQYHGGGTSVTIQVIDDVIVSRFPMRPNVILNILFALVAGVVLGGAYVLAHESYRVEYGPRQQKLLDDEIKEEVYTPDGTGAGFNLQPSFSYSTPEVAQNWKIIEE